jgi:hypothetical protein
MAEIPFKSKAGKNKAFCPGCGNAVRIIGRSIIHVATEHFDYQAEGVTTRCDYCGVHQISRVVQV